MYSQDNLVLAAYIFGSCIHRTLLFLLLTFLAHVFTGHSCSCCLHFCSCIHRTLLFLLLTFLAHVFTGHSCSCCLQFWLMYSQDTHIYIYIYIYIYIFGPDEWVEITRLANRLYPGCCYCADDCQLSLIALMQCEVIFFSKYFTYFMTLKRVFILLKINCCTFCSYFILGYRNSLISSDQMGTLYPKWIPIFVMVLSVLITNIDTAVLLCVPPWHPK
jgi:hypothetical protein